MAKDKASKGTSIVDLTDLTNFDKDVLTNSWNGMPSDDIEPSKKRGVWALAWARFIYSQFYNSQCFTTWDKLREYRLLRLYGAGAQPREIYMDRLNPLEPGESERKGWYNVNWDIWSPAPKYKRIVIGRFESQAHNIQANAIDKQSGAEREDMMWDSWSKALFQKQVQALKQAARIPQTDLQKEYLPESLEELQMYSELGGFKMKKEIDTQKAIDYTDYISNEKRLKRKTYGDLFDINIGAQQDYFDSVEKKIMWRYLDPEYSIFDYSKDEDFSDMRFWATQKLVSIKRVREESGVSENVLRRLALTWATYFGNLPESYVEGYTQYGYRNKDGIYCYDQYKVPIWYCEWMSIDTKYKQTRKTKDGDLSFTQKGDEYGKVYDTDKRKTEITEKQNVYTATWIVGSDIVYNDGVLDFVPRDAKKRVKMTAHVYALDGPSIVSSIRDNLDRLQLTKLKLENALAKARPSGIKIEFGALNNLSFGSANSPEKLITLFNHTGDIIYKVTTHAGKYNSYASPIEPTVGGMGPFLEECLRLIEFDLNMIAEMSGIDRVSAVSRKPGEQTATETKLAVAATTDALQGMYQAYVDIRERAAKNAAYRIQTIVKHIPASYDVYYPVFGQAMMEELKLSSDSSDYGIRLELQPTDDEKQSVMSAAQEALKPGKDGEQISFGEYLLIMEMVKQGQIKQAIAVLNFRLNKRKKEALQLQQDNMRFNGENMVKQEEAKRQTMIAAKNADLLKEIVKGLISKEQGLDEHLQRVTEMIIDGNINQQPDAQQNAPAQPQANAA